MSYFKRVWEGHSFSIQEGALICLYSMSLIVNLITYFEVLMYKYYVIDTAYVKLYIRDTLQLMLYVLSCLAILTFATKHNRKETADDRDTI